MKKIILLSCLLLLGLSAWAQITNPPAPPNPVTLPTQILNYFTAFNTNLDSTFGNNRFDLWIGAASVQNTGHPLLNTIGGSYDIWRPTPGTNGTQLAIAPEIDTRNEGVAGSLISAQGGIGLSALIHDTKATIYLNGGKYIPSEFDPWFGEIGLRVKKAFGLHFYGGLGLGIQYRSLTTAQKVGHSDWGQVFTAYTGVTF
jgi:hypothetical protein